MSLRGLACALLMLCLVPSVFAEPPPPLFVTEGDATFTLQTRTGTCTTSAQASFFWESTALPDDPHKGMFQAIAPPKLGCFTGQANEEFSQRCERYQSFGVRCVSLRGATFQLADDRTFQFQETYAQLGDVVYVNGTMGGVMPCARTGYEYTYFPCPGLSTRMP